MQSSETNSTRFQLSSQRVYRGIAEQLKDSSTMGLTARRMCTDLLPISDYLAVLEQQSLK